MLLEKEKCITNNVLVYSTGSPRGPRGPWGPEGPPGPYIFKRKEVPS